MTAEGWRRCWGLLLGKSASICLQMEEFNNSECSLILIVQWIFYILQWMLYWKYLTLNEFLGNSFISLFESLKHWNIHCLNTKIRRRHTYGIWTLDCSGFTHLNMKGSRETWRDSSSPASSSSTTHHYHQPPPWSFSAASAVAKLRCALHLNQLKLAKARILFFTFTLSFSKLHLGLIGAFSCDWASTKLQQTINLTGEQWSAQRRGGARGRNLWSMLSFSKASVWMRNRF